MRTDTERLDWLSRQEGNLFTPETDGTKPGRWVWYGNDGKGSVGDTLRELIDDAMQVSK